MPFNAQHFAVRERERQKRKRGMRERESRKQRPLRAHFGRAHILIKVMDTDSHGIKG